MPDTVPVALPAGRYGGTTRRGRVTMWALGGTMALLLVAWAAWVAVGVARQPVQWSDAIAAARPDGSVEVTFQVTIKPGRTAVCTVEALNVGFDRVGVVDVTVGPAITERITVRAIVPTSERAVSGDVKACVVR